MKKLTVRDLVLCALMAALLAVCAWISVPVLEIAYTLQTFGVFFALLVLGGARGTLAILVYILLGAVGLPVFTGFRGGIDALLGVTGGYILGFLFTGLVYWLVTGLLGRKLWVKILALVLGLVVCYAFGSGWFLAVYFRNGKSIGVWALLMKCVIPYLPADAIKMALALVLAPRVAKAVKA